MDIVLLSKEKANIEKLNIIKFDIVSLIKSIINRFEIMDVKFKFDYDDEIIVKADIKRLEQVIYNLLTNALNHVGDDKMVIIDLIDETDKVRINITDHGKGIKKEDLKLIWRKYYKVDKKYRRDKKGSGIGLSIVESILKKHKFKYGAESELNKGTTFYFEVKK